MEICILAFWVPGIFLNGTSLLPTVPKVSLLDSSSRFISNMNLWLKVLFFSVYFEGEIQIYSAQIRYSLPIPSPTRCTSVALILHTEECKNPHQSNSNILFKEKKSAKTIGNSEWEESGEERNWHMLPEKVNNTEKKRKWETTELSVNSLTIAKKLEAKMC